MPTQNIISSLIFPHTFQLSDWPPALCAASTDVNHAVRENKINLPAEGCDHTYMAGRQKVLCWRKAAGLWGSLPAHQWTFYSGFAHRFGEMPTLEWDPPRQSSREMSFIRGSSLSLVQAGWRRWLSLCSLLVWLHLEHCVWFSVPQYKRVIKL